MLRIGPSFLHRPLPRVASLSWGRLFEWFVEGLAIAAPKKLRETGWRAVHRLIRAGSLEGAATPLVIERSLLGAVRLAPRPDDCEVSIPLAIEICSNDIFETFMDLPYDARRYLREATSRRLEALSPLPASDVDFAIGSVPSMRADRLRVPIAIVRKGIIDELLRSPEGPKIGIIGAFADDFGNFRYVFHRAATVRANDAKAQSRALAIAAAALIFILGAVTHLERRIEAATAHEEALIAALREEMKLAGFLSDPPTAAPSMRPVESVIHDLGRLSTNIPDGVWLEETSITPDGVAASGFAREGIQWPEGITATAAPSDRPGINRITLQFEKTSAP